MDTVWPTIKGGYEPPVRKLKIKISGTMIA